MRGANQTQRTATLQRWKYITHHGACRRRNAARANALNGAAHNDHPKTRRRGNQQRSDGKNAHTRQIHRATTVAIAEIGHQRRATKRKEHKDTHDQTNLAVVHAKGGAKHRNGRTDYGRVERRHKDADEQHRHKSAPQ